MANTVMANGQAERNKEKIDHSGSDLKKVFVNAENQMEKYSKEAGEKAGQVATELKESAVKAVENGREYLKENPATSILFATIVGIITGTVLTLTLRRKPQPQ